jgi:carbon storage regulator
MLVLSRRQGESIVIGGDVRVTVVGVSGNQVKLSIEAPRSVPVYRSEVWEAIRKENRQAAEADVQPSLSSKESAPLSQSAGACADLRAGGSIGRLVAKKPEDGKQERPGGSENKNREQ